MNKRFHAVTLGLMCDRCEWVFFEADCFCRVEYVAAKFEPGKLSCKCSFWKKPRYRVISCQRVDVEPLAACPSHPPPTIQ